MAEGREPIAWVNASRMSGRSYVFVEGSADVCFWKKFIDTHTMAIQQVSGWEAVVASVRTFNKESLNGNCIGIIDRDFENIYPSKHIKERNIFMTDYHDLEMMLYLSEAWEPALGAIDKKNQLKATPQEILTDVFSITDRIGCLKLSSQKKQWGLVFKKQNKSHDFELPKYENAISQTGMYLGDDKLIEYICSFYRSNSHGKLPAIGQIKTEFDKVNKEENPSEHLSNGHDITYVMSHILRRKYGLKANYVSVDTIEIALNAAYDVSLLKQTQLYRSIVAWGKKNSKNIFL